MRVFIVLVLTAIFCASALASPAGQVFGYECKMIDSKVTYFKCGYDKDGLIITLEKKPDLSPSDKEQNTYKFNSLLLRFFQLGGKNLTIKHHEWPEGRVRLCSLPRNKPFYKFRCYDCTWKYDADGSGTCERH